MGKPMWVRVCGWAWLVSLVVFIVGAFYDNANGIDAASQAWMMLTVPSGLLFAPAWVIGTLVHRSRVRRARINAAAMQDALRRQSAAAPQRGL